MKATLQSLVTRWEKEAKTYHDQYPVPAGSSPSNITHEQQNAANLSGLLRAKAHELKSIIKTLE